MKLINRLALLLILVSLTGCTVLTPKTYQLEQIHQNYTTEWAESVSALPLASPNPTVVDGKGSFTKTLAGIKNYKTEHGDTSKVAAHLTVLEGMIYIQTGKPGMAKLLEPEVKAAREKLKSATGVVTRDYLFADCYEYLTQGWEAISKSGIDVIPKDFIDPADKIKEKLNKIPKENRAAADVDSGGAFVATTAAIFYIYAHASDMDNIKLEDMAKKGKEVLKPWLSKNEICSVEKGIYKKSEFDWGSRFRYMEWYDFLHTGSGRETQESCQ